MPFIAECLFCHRKLRVPDHAAGWSFPCPRCGNSFTLVGSPESTTTAHPGPDAATAVSAAPLPVTAPPVMATALPPLPRVPARPRRVSYLGLASFLLASLGLLCASLPPVEALSLPLAGLGLLLGGLGILLASGPALVLPGAGVVVSVGVLVVAGFWPELLDPTRAPAVARPGPVLQMPVGKGNGLAQPAEEEEWVDASRDAVQQGDVRVRVLSAAVQGVDFKALGPARRERCLVLALRVYNVGGERRVAYASWAEVGAGREADAPRLRDDLGRTYRRRPLGAGVTLAGHVAQATLPPGRHVDDLLVFETVPAGRDDLRLELPASACGATGTWRLRLPRSMVVER